MTVPACATQVLTFDGGLLVASAMPCRSRHACSEADCSNSDPNRAMSNSELSRKLDDIFGTGPISASSHTWPRTIRTLGEGGLYHPAVAESTACLDGKTSIQAFNGKDPVWPLPRPGTSRVACRALVAALFRPTLPSRLNLRSARQRQLPEEFVAFLADIAINQPRGKENPCNYRQSLGQQEQPVKGSLEALGL
jgi:hypothetical protein